MESYLLWLKEANIQAVPIPYDISEAELNRVSANLSGFFFTGGPSHLVKNKDKNPNSESAPETEDVFTKF